MRVVIIGAGPAGVTVAETLCQHDSAEIVMISSEPYPPYSPPAMLEYFSTGREVHFWKGRDFPGTQRIDYRQGVRVEAVVPEKREIRLAGGEAMRYDRLVLASGARLYVPIKGEDKPGAYNFKSLSAAEELMGRVREGRAKTALIVGVGLIGVEVGLILADMGLKVTQLVRSRVMRSILDDELARMVQEAMGRRGVRVLQGADADAVAFVGEPRVEGVQTRGGEVLQADLIIVATGLKPNIEYLAGSGVKTDWGVLVDDYLRTNVAEISAAGDVAETANRVTGRRSVQANFPNAVAQGRVAAYNVLGWEVRYEGADSMNSLKHLGLPLMAVGRMGGEELRVRGGDSLRKLYLEDGRIIGFGLYGDISSAGIYRALMNKGVDVAALKHRLLEPRFGMGFVEGLALDSRTMFCNPVTSQPPGAVL
jgi:NAD(P)H-nitrite reductase large subunit